MEYPGDNDNNNNNDNSDPNDDEDDDMEIEWIFEKPTADTPNPDDSSQAIAKKDIVVLRTVNDKTTEWCGGLVHSVNVEQNKTTHTIDFYGKHLQTVDLSQVRWKLGVPPPAAILSTQAKSSKEPDGDEDKPSGRTKGIDLKIAPILKKKRTKNK